MSIQFNCDSCTQRLKVPAGSAGKKVRCPQCETVNIIPDTSAEEPAMEDVARPHDRGTQSDNPFASPSYSAEESGPYTPDPLPTDLQLTKQSIDIGDVFEQTWRRFKLDIGTAILFGLVIAGFAFGSWLLGLLPNLLALSDVVVLVVLGSLVVYVIQAAISAYQQCIGKRFSLNVGRSNSELLGGIFSTEKVVEVLLFFLLVFLVICAAAAVVLAPIGIAILIDGNNGGPATMIGGIITLVLGIAAVVVGVIATYRLYLCLYFVIDRNMGVFDSMRMSNEFMRGNCLMVWLTTLIAGLGAGMVTVCTCGLGFFVAAPFVEVMNGVIYLKITGQYQNIDAQ